MFHCYRNRKETRQVLPGRATSMVSIITTRSNYSSILTIGAPTIVDIKIDILDRHEKSASKVETLEKRNSALSKVHKKREMFHILNLGVINYLSDVSDCIKLTVGNPNDKLTINWLQLSDGGVSMRLEAMRREQLMNREDLQRYANKNGNTSGEQMTTIYRDECDNAATSRNKEPHGNRNADEQKRLESKRRTRHGGHLGHFTPPAVGDDKMHALHDGNVFEKILTDSNCTSCEVIFVAPSAVFYIPPSLDVNETNASDACANKAATKWRTSTLLESVKENTLKTCQSVFECFSCFSTLDNTDKVAKTDGI